MSVELVVGDGGSELFFTFKSKATGELKDLTGKTVNVEFRVDGGPLQTRAATVLDQATKPGQASYRLLTSDLSSVGTLTGQAVVDPNTADQLTSLELFNLTIRARL